MAKRQRGPRPDRHPSRTQRHGPAHPLQPLHPWPRRHPQPADRPRPRTRQQRPGTLNPFWFFILSSPYVLTTIAIALILGICWLRRIGSPPIGESDEDSAVFIAATMPPMAVPAPRVTPHPRPAHPAALTPGAAGRAAPAARPRVPTASP